MIPEGVSFVLETLGRHGVRCLLMGGQACVLHGAAEFSKDVDFVLLPEPDNLEKLRTAMAALEAEVIAVPSFEPQYLDEGLAVHFRCQHPKAAGLRIDVMTKLRNVDHFDALWERRAVLKTGAEEFSFLSVPDLVQAKKTQRSKDWPMIERLVEISYLSASDEPDEAEIRLWLKELRNSGLLVEAATKFNAFALELTKERPLLEAALQGNEDVVRRLLVEEMETEKTRDRVYWEPLKKRLGEIRRGSRN